MKKISVTKYLEYIDQQRDDNFMPCRIKKISFVWKKKTYSIEDHQIGNKTFHLLLVGRGKDDISDSVELLPEFLQVKIEKIVTDDEEYDFSKLYHK